MRFGTDGRSRAGVRGESRRSGRSRESIAASSMCQANSAFAARLSSSKVPSARAKSPRRAKGMRSPLGQKHVVDAQLLVSRSHRRAAPSEGTHCPGASTPAQGTPQAPSSATSDSSQRVFPICTSPVEKKQHSNLFHSRIAHDRTITVSAVPLLDSPLHETPPTPPGCAGRPS